MSPTFARATAPVRVDLAGGTVDLWPLNVLLANAITVNLAVSLRAGCEVTVGGDSWRFAPEGSAEVSLARLPARPESVTPPRVQLAAVVAAHLGVPPCRISTWSEAAPGSGLGGSSSLVMALIAAGSAIAGRQLGADEAVTLACNLETRVLGKPAGNQDHWAAWCGGLAVLRYGPEGVVRTAAAHGRDLAAALVVADTGVQHHSGMNNWIVLRAALDGDASVREALERIGDAAARMADAVLADLPPEQRLRQAREALRDEWTWRRRLAPAVSCPEVEAVVAAAERVGGAAKVCGAGGGGCVACLAGPGGRGELAEAVAATGARVLDLEPSDDGVRLERVE